MKVFGQWILSTLHPVRLLLHKDMAQAARNGGFHRKLDAGEWGFDK
jgi:hypothetical protein